jgi:hypothetical protein
MSQIKINAGIAYIPSKYFPNDNKSFGKIIRRFKDPGGYIRFDVLWDSGKLTTIPEYLLINNTNYKAFNNQKEFLLFKLKSS